MTPMDVLEVSATIIASLGGGGGMVFGLSSYLGKVWADRGLAEQRQRYDQLNIEFSHQLDIVTRRLQIELDALGHLHKLRREGEFERLQQLWKALSALRIAYRIVPNRATLGEELSNSLKDYIETKTRDLALRIAEAQAILDEHTLLIPKDIADLANQTIGLSRAETENVAFYGEEVKDNRGELLDNMEKLETMMRQHFHGDEADHNSEKPS